MIHSNQVIALAKGRLLGPAGRRLRMAGLACALALLGAPGGAATPAVRLPVAPVQAEALASTRTDDGQVQALRQATVAAQVAGTVLELNVRAGDAVRAGQVLLRIDARAAEQGAAASTAQVAAAQAALDAATSELARKRQLADKKYISQGALEQAESQYRSAQAQVRALAAQAGAARTQTGLHVLRAPFDGVVAQLGVERGDMAMPGRPLLTVYDPAALRVAADVPASALRGQPLRPGAVRVLLAGAAVAPVRVQILPTVDPQTLTQTVRADLPPATQAVPGQFARLQWTDGGGATPRIHIPVSAVVRRADVAAVYVMGEGQQPQLRQVRLGPVHGERVEVLAGLDAGEPLITDPQAATRAVAGTPAGAGR